MNGTLGGDIDPRAAGPMKKLGIRGPILADPIYKENYTGRTPRPAARVKSEAAEIANKSRGVVAKLFSDEVRRYDDRPKTGEFTTAATTAAPAVTTAATSAA